MKFAYIDKSGSTEECDVFVMASLLIDAYRLRKYTSRFDQELAAFLARYPDAPNEFKTKGFINGRGGWNTVSADDCKQLLTDMCALAAEVSSIYGFGRPFDRFNAACASGTYTAPCAGNCWALNGMFVSGPIQKKMQGRSINKGLTVLIFDDNNKAHMFKMSDGLYLAGPWFDALYQQSKKVKGKNQWCELKQPQRFDRIIDTAFAIKSQHASAGRGCRELHVSAPPGTQPEAYAGEQAFYAGLLVPLDAKRKRLGRTPDAECIDFYNAVKHPAWVI